MLYEGALLKKLPTMPSDPLTVHIFNHHHINTSPTEEGFELHVGEKNLVDTWASYA